MKIKRAKSRIKIGASCIIALVCVVGICYSGYKIYEWTTDSISTGDQTEIINDAATTREIDDSANTQIISSGEADDAPYWKYLHTKLIDVDFDELRNINSETAGWIQLGGTNINYPVMHTPDEPQYYLQRAFDKSNATGGTPFLDGKCTEDGGIYIIYGHHMSNGTMFASLPDYENMEYWQEHKTIRFDTLYEQGKYEVVAAFLSRIYAPEHKGFRYYEYTDLKSEVQFDSFIEQVKENELYDTGVTAEYGDTLLVLSTCNYHTDDGRFVVVARKTAK
ncbi:MAG: class B sortase [Candidatus Saccharibacteria bacterium]|nr:class B sortase [Candidatus Saccharibacteria bacterium]